MQEALQHVLNMQTVLQNKASELGISTYELQTPDGKYPFIDLLLAEANLRLAIAMMRGVMPMPTYQGSPCVCGRARPCGGPHDCAMV
jgi:hypothetical protein